MNKYGASIIPHSIAVKSTAHTHFILGVIACHYERMLGHLVKTFRKNSFQPFIAEYVQDIVRRILFHNLSEQFGREVSHGGFEILRQKMYLKAVPWKLHTQPTTQNCVMELDKKLSSITSG